MSGKTNNYVHGQHVLKINDSESRHSNRNIHEVRKATSLSTLVIWNISKALEKNPSMDVKSAVKAAQARLACERDMKAMIPDSAEQRHLACAMLAWQQLGHSDADSLYEFVVNKRKEQKPCAQFDSEPQVEAPVKSPVESKYSEDVYSTSFGTNTIGPVVKLPVETKIIMRMETSPSARQTEKKPQAPVKDTMNKIATACCLESACVERLAKMDTAIAELRMRAGTLASREAERAELLERAEAAWKDLETGYQRRLALNEEKEDELTKQMEKLVDERNEYKTACTCLASDLRQKGELAEKDRGCLSQAEKTVCTKACLRLKLSEEGAQLDALLAESQCRAAQLDRDLQFKEEQARRRLLNFQSELESSQTITHDTERAMRAELVSLREQVASVSAQLIEEDANNTQIKIELEEFREDKAGMIEDLEGCKDSCDSRMQGKVDELNNKRKQLEEIRAKVIECRCKLPVDASVEVKRTASLAALCRCTPEEKVLESCSCTSLCSKLLTNLLGDLFSGLQAEMEGAGTLMPCHLLKCLDDKHNWDRASVVKNNLTSYFTQLLIGELDIAIATSIVKYHARWVGQSCADTSRMIPDQGEVENEGWQQRAIERRAQKLATKLAEQLFEERAEQLTQRAKDIVASGPPPCECKSTKPAERQGAAVYPVLVRHCAPRKPLPQAPAAQKPVTPPQASVPIASSCTPPAYWHQAMQDVTQLRMQIENLKKDSVKKEDLKLMEEKITKIVCSSVSGKCNVRGEATSFSNEVNDTATKKELKNNRAATFYQPNNSLNSGKPTSSPKKQLDISTNSFNKKGLKSNIVQYTGLSNNFKPYKKHEQSFAINMCMCSQKDYKNRRISQPNKITNGSFNEDLKGFKFQKERPSKDSTNRMTNSVKQTKPIDSDLQSQNISTGNNSKSSSQPFCPSNCVCFHKIPSNASIDRLLETLAKWKSDKKSPGTGKECIHQIPCSINKKQLIDENGKSLIETHDTIQNVHDKEFSETNVLVKESTDCNQNLSTARNQFENTNENNKDKFERTDSINLNSLSSKKVQAKTRIENDCGSNINSTYMHRDLNIPDTTVSEYMGAINLDKSNDDICKCTNKNEILSVQPNKPFKCMPCKCSCKSITSQKGKTQAGDIAKVTSSEKKQLKKSSQKSNSPVISKIGSNTSELENISCGCGYDIQFLGVTLTDVSPQNGIENQHDENLTVTNDHQGKTIKNKTSNIDTDGNKHKVNIKETNNLNIVISDDNRQNSNNENVKEHENKNMKDKILEYQTSITNTTRNIKYENTAPNKKSNEDQYQNINDVNNIESCSNYKSCECKTSYGELKTYINLAFKNVSTIEDKGLDVQSFKDSKNEDEPCVCCNEQNDDDSQELEKNTFHLLEEHLKKKLEAFKETSCNSTCIPPEDEEKLFTTILARVKKIIKESTNQISCKCPSDKDKPLGSWNRAYGLLQEYLKTKITRVKCSCVLGDDNNNKVLPDVLDRVCNLIEQDFQRLKDVCGCKKTDLLMENSVKDYFKNELPERDIDINNIKKNSNGTINSCRSQNPQTSAILKENISLQVPINLGMDTKSCDPLETYSKYVETLQNTNESFKSSKTVQDCDCCGKNIDAELLVTNNSTKTQPLNFSNLPYVGYASECKCKGIECTINSKQILNNAYSNSVFTKSSFEKNTSNKMIKSEELDIYNMVINKPDAELIGNNEIETNKELQPVVNTEYTRDPKTSLPYCPKNVNNKLNNDKNDILPCVITKPYIGYTIDCLCDNGLANCVCLKSKVETDYNVVDSIMKKYIPDEKYYEKVSYITKHNENNDNLKNIESNTVRNMCCLQTIHKHKALDVNYPKLDRQTAVSIEDEDIVLKNSKEFFLCSMAHNTTSTDDNMSVDTYYSNTLEPDWCECCSHNMPTHYTNSDQLKRSIYFPVPLEDSDECEESVIIKDDRLVHTSLPKHCDCDMVPICHVKMLVENIENKLAGAKCTCDSLISKVCPIHSKES